VYTNVDIDAWARRDTYAFFKDYDDPFFNIAANVDVTSLYAMVKANSLSFSLAMLFASLVTANQIREFRIRLVDGTLVEFETIHATQTILNKDDSFSFAYFGMAENIFDFDRAGKIALAKYKALKTFDVETDRKDLIYYSVIPWISFTSFKHASRLDKHQTIPRIVFGKAFDAGMRKLIPVSVEANHAIMDGVHVGRFFEGLQANIETVSS
jgi:chloramphenicol O-acetyltransferase type A